MKTSKSNATIWALDTKPTTNFYVGAVLTPCKYTELCPKWQHEIILGPIYGNLWEVHLVKHHHFHHCPGRLYSLRTIIRLRKNMFINKYKSFVVNNSTHWWLAEYKIHKHLMNLINCLDNYGAVHNSICHYSIEKINT